MNRKAVKFSKSEYAPPEILIPFGHCRLLPNLSISVRRTAGNNSNTGLGLFYGNSMLMSHAQSGSHIWTWTRTYGGTEEAELHIFGSQGKAEVWKRNFRSLEVLAKMKCGSGLIHIWKSWQNKCGRWTRSFESWPSGSTENGTPDLWQSRQRRSAEAQLHIFESPGRDEMRKWTLHLWQVLILLIATANVDE